MEKDVMGSNRRFKINLTKNERSSKYETTKLKEHLGYMGLNCASTSLENLEKMKKKVLQDYNNNGYQLFGVFRLDNKTQTVMQLDTQGTWKLDDNPEGMIRELITVSSVKGFEYLKGNVMEFTGKRSNGKRTNNKADEATVTNTFETITKSMTSLITSSVQDVDLDAMISVLLGKNEFSSSKEYKRTVGTYYGLVNDYADGLAKSVAILNFSVVIHINDMNEKKSTKYELTFEHDARFVPYGKLEYLDEEYNNVKAHVTL